MPNSKKGLASIALVIGLIVLVVGAFLYLVIRRSSNCLTIYNLIYLPPGDSISQKRVEGEASCPKAVSFVGKGSLWELEEKDAHEGPRRYQFNTDTTKFEQGDGRKYTFVNDGDNKPALVGFIGNTFVFITNNRDSNKLSNDEMVKIFNGLERQALEIRIPSFKDLFPKVKVTFEGQQTDRPTMPNTFTRTYSQTLKSTFNPGKELVDRMMTEYVNEVKAVGFNTITIYVLHQYDNGVMKVVSPVGGPNFSDSADSQHMTMIEAAKNNGFAVYLGLEFGGGHNPPLGVPQQQFLEDTKKAALKWAEIGERYKVEYFAPATEMDFHINKEYFTNSPASTENVLKVVNKFHQDILPELRSVFKGKLVYQHASFISTNVDAAGYDYVGPDFGPGGMGVEAFRAETRKYLRNAALVAKKSRTDWILPEFGVAFKKPEKNNPGGGEQLKNSLGQSMDDLQDEYYQVFIEEYLGFDGEPKPQGLGLFSYIHPISAVKDRATENLVKEFLGNI